MDGSGTSVVGHTRWQLGVLGCHLGQVGVLGSLSREQLHVFDSLSEGHWVF